MLLDQNGIPAVQPNDYHQPLNSPLTGALTFSLVCLEKGPSDPA
jgi:hypothetical protein